MRPRAQLLTLTTAVVAAFALPKAAPAQTRGDATRGPWGQCCGMAPWPQGPGMGPGMMGPGGRGMMGPGGHGMMGRGGAGMARNRAAMMGGVPAPYAGLSNPLPQTKATVERGAQVYAANCASCHGDTGFGDGPAGRGLSPPPGNLAWLSRMPMSRWDPFMYWTVAEGGAPVGSAMPAFKQSLSKEDTWAVIAYIQARLPPGQTK